jgi:predicted RNA-binding Zn-ribbon protein involved in translation (DUF1610 family)
VTWLVDADNQECVSCGSIRVFREKGEKNYRCDNCGEIRRDVMGVEKINPVFGRRGEV